MKTAALQGKHKGKFETSHPSQAGVEAGTDTAASGLLEGLRLMGHMLEAGSVAESLQGAFQCAWPGFSTDFARVLSSPQVRR